jgi:cob(I)alamin adenosyltransferase
MQNRRKGLILVFTGDGKGKTTASLGLALRAMGQGLKVMILQFMKGQENIGELRALSRFNLPIEFKQFGRTGFVQSRACEPLDIYLAHLGLECFESALINSHHDMIILDEILVAIDFGLVKVSDLCRILELKSSGTHLVLTGRHAHADILEKADLVTEMIEVKHPYQQGVKAQIGIEF